MKNIVLFFLCLFYFDSFAQSEVELNFNGPILPIGKYAQSNLFYGMETIGYAEIGYGVEFKFLKTLNNKRFKIGAGIHYFQNPHRFKKLDYAFNNYLGCDSDPFVCGFDNYFGWDVLYKVTNWKNLDINLIVGVNILEHKRIRYSVLFGGGGTMHISPKYYYNIGFDNELESHVSFSFNVTTEQNVKIKLTEKLSLNTSLVYRISKVRSKFTKNLIDDYVYYDFWQQTLSTKVGLVYLFKK